MANTSSNNALPGLNKIGYARRWSGGL